MAEIVLIESWDAYLTLSRVIPRTVHRGLMNVEVRWTCIDATDDWIAIGTDAEVLYMYDRNVKEMLVLQITQTKSPISKVKLICRVDQLVAMGFEDGLVLVYERSCEDSPNQKKDLHIIRMHRAGITCLEWSKNAMKLFSGDRHGTIVCTEIDFLQHKTYSSIVCDEQSSVVQLSYQHMRLLISTKRRTVVWNVENSSFTQVGSQERKIRGAFGATFVPDDYETACPDALYASRPGLYLWKSDPSGVVSRTLKFKNSLPPDPIQGILLLCEFRNFMSSSSHYDPQFGPLLLYPGENLLTYSESGIFVIGTKNQAVLCWHRMLPDICDVVVNGDEVFILRGSQTRRLIRLSQTHNRFHIPPTIAVSSNSTTNEETHKKGVFGWMLGTLKGIGSTFVPVKEGFVDFKTDPTDDVCAEGTILNFDCTPGATSDKSAANSASGVERTTSSKDSVSDGLKFDLIPSVEGAPSNVDCGSNGLFDRSLIDSIPIVQLDPNDFPPLYVNREMLSYKIPGLTERRNSLPVDLASYAKCRSMSVTNEFEADESEDASRAPQEDDIVFSSVEQKVRKKKKASERHRSRVVSSLSDARSRSLTRSPLSSTDSFSHEIGKIKSLLTNPGVGHSPLWTLNSLDSKDTSTDTVRTSQSSVCCGAGTSASEDVQLSVVEHSTDGAMADKDRTTKESISLHLPLKSEQAFVNEPIVENVLKQLTSCEKFTEKTSNLALSVDQNRTQLEPCGSLCTPSPTENFHSIYSPNRSENPQEVFEAKEDEFAAKNDSRYATNELTAKDKTSGSKASGSRTNILTSKKDDKFVPCSNVSTPDEKPLGGRNESPARDVWTEFTTPGPIRSMCFSSKHVWVVDGLDRLYYSALSGPGLTWVKTSQMAHQISVSPSTFIVWKLYRNSISVANKVSPKSPAGTDSVWREVAKEVAYISVDNSVAWYVKVNGDVMMQKDLTEKRTSFRSYIVPCQYQVTRISCRNGIVMAVTQSRDLLVRFGIAKGTEEGTIWIVIAGTSTNRPTISVQIGANGVLWLLDELCKLWFTTEVTASQPKGCGQWFQVLLNNHELDCSTRSFWEILPIFCKSTARVILASDLSGGIWISGDGKPSLRCSQGILTGHRWDAFTPSGMISSMRWRHVSCYSAEDDDATSVLWLQQFNGSIFCVISPGPNSRIIEVLPPVIGKSFEIFTASTAAIWGVLPDSQTVYVRRGMAAHCRQGLDWVTVNYSSQLGSVNFVHLNVGRENVWAVDDRGAIYHRIGSRPPQSERVNPVWVEVTNAIPLASGARITNVFTCPDDSMVWAIDNRKSVYVRGGISDRLPLGLDWNLVPGVEGVSICISRRFVYVVNDNEECFVREGITRDDWHGDYWKKIPGMFQSLTTSKNDDLWALDRDGQLFRRHFHELRISSNRTRSAQLTSTASASSVSEDWEVIG